MKKWIGLAIALLLLLGGIYVGSPYYAAWNLKAAAVSGDAGRLDAAVDFAAVRASLKTQLSAMLIDRIIADPNVKQSAFAGLGRIMMPAIVDRTVDAVVNPDSLAALVRGSRSFRAREAPGTQNLDVRYDYQWVGTDHFRLSLTNIRTQEAGPSLLFERRGLASWKVIELRLPERMLGDP
jgi:hypothetical protein